MFRHANGVWAVKTPFLRLAGTVVWGVSMLATAHAEVDVDAAKALARSNDCLKCHAADRDKQGPSIAKIAAKFKSRPDAQAMVIKHVTTGPTVKLPDGVEIRHKIIDTTDPKDLANIADWFLSH